MVLLLLLLNIFQISFIYIFEIKKKTSNLHLQSAKRLCTSDSADCDCSPQLVVRSACRLCYFLLRIEFLVPYVRERAILFVFILYCVLCCYFVQTKASDICHLKSGLLYISF